MDACRQPRFLYRIALRRGRGFESRRMRHIRYSFRAPSKRSAKARSLRAFAFLQVRPPDRIACQQTAGRRKLNPPRGITGPPQPDLTLVLDASVGRSVNLFTEPAGQLNFNASLRSRHAHLAPTHDFKEEIACQCAITPSFRSSPPCCSPVAPATTDSTMTTIARWVIRKP